MSVTKSFTGVLAGILVAEDKLDPAAPVTAYVPELEPSAFGDATVEQVMDMTTGLKYTEVYTDANSDVWAMRRANGMAHREPGARRSRCWNIWRHKKSKASTVACSPTRRSTRTSSPGLPVA